MAGQEQGVTRVEARSAVQDKSARIQGSNAPSVAACQRPRVSRYAKFVRHVQESEPTGKQVRDEVFHKCAEVGWAARQPNGDKVTSPNCEDTRHYLKKPTLRVAARTATRPRMNHYPIETRIPRVAGTFRIAPRNALSLMGNTVGQLRTEALVDTARRSCRRRGVVRQLAEQSPSVSLNIPGRLGPRFDLSIGKDSRARLIASGRRERVDSTGDDQPRCRGSAVLIDRVPPGDSSSRCGGPHRHETVRQKKITQLESTAKGLVTR